MKKVRGCEKDLAKPLIIEKQEVKRCVLKLITPASLAYINLYGHYKEGFLYYAGGVSSQGIKYMDAMKYIQSEVERITEEMRGHQ